MNREEIIQQAQASIDACKQLLAQTGMTPQSCFDRLRQLGGQAAVDKVQREVEDTLRGIDEQINRDASHAVPTRPVSRYVAQRGGI